jgi:hypothetical protein
MKETSLRLLAALPVPDATWEPKEPATRPAHHPRGILRHASGVHPIVVVPESPEKTAAKRAESA